MDLLVNGTGSITATQNNFRVEFTEASIEPDTNDVSINQDKISATFSISGLSAKGEIATATYTIENFSNNIGAEIDLRVSNSNTEYFRVSHVVYEPLLNAGDITTACVFIELIKTPIDGDVTTDIVAELIANPVDDDSIQTGGEMLVRQISDVVKYGFEVTHPNNSSVISNLNELKDTFAEGRTYYGIPALIEFHIDEYNWLSYSNLAFQLGNNPVTILEYGRSNVTANRNTIETLFGSENCSQNDDAYTCSNSDNGTLNVTVYDNGSLHADGGESWQCNVNRVTGSCSLGGVSTID